MARKPNVLPSYLLHKQSGQARVRIDGKDILLGAYGSEESRIRYGELIANYSGGVQIDPFAKSNRGRFPRNDSEADSGPSVGELCLVFLRHAEGHYVKNGEPTSEISVLKSVIRPLNELYGMLPAKDFGPLALKAVRQKMVESGWCRSSINTGVSRIRRIFKHAIANELIDSSVLERLKCVAPLLAGRTEAHDNAPRKPVAIEDIEKIRKSVSSLICDLIDIQRLTGARSGELLKLTTRMIDRSGDVWFAELTDHKTRHHGQSRTLYFGPQAQLILVKYLSAEPDKRLFKITRNGYRRAITRTCEKLEIDRWVPHQLRHTVGHAVREEFGLEHTQAVLGHATADMTQHYAKISGLKAAEVARKIG
ncbi:MAG: tyrosine-type recombinase/integrase [Planctomyces sp.]|nr:tyrosine-type recombinase/integrase [Planctomyces sp.]